jgi:ATP-dependent RNA helicase RhlE
MPFSELGLEKGILKAIEKAGYLRPTPVQSAAIPKIMRGDDLTAIAQTGTGKTAAFVLPILHHLSARKAENKLHGTLSLILAPTRELAVQITENIHSYGRHLTIRVAAIYGGVDETSQIRAARKGANIIVATPGRLIDLLGRHKLDFSRLEILVLDEADRMLHMGFLPDIETIVAALPKHRQTLMFSATFPREVESLAKRFQHDPKRVQVGAQNNPADTVKQSVYEVSPHLKDAMLLALLKDAELARVLVFVRMKDGANRLTEILRKENISVTRLHSGRTQEKRQKALADFKQGTVRVLVATDLAARGIDIEGVSHVVNYDFPVNAEDYIHRIGRTGRAEHEGEAISLVPKGDLNLLGILEMAIGQRLPRKRLRGFDYHAKSPAIVIQPAKKDWRKRTREREAGKAPKPAGFPLRITAKKFPKSS